MRTLGVEAGRRFPLADDLTLTPQAWLTRSDVSMDGFRDAVGSRVSPGKTDRSVVGLGIVTETSHSWDGGERKLDLRGRLGVERVLGDAETAADVSGERLVSEAARTRGVLSLGAAYRWNRWSLGRRGFPPPAWARTTAATPLHRQPPPRDAVLGCDRTTASSEHAQGSHQQPTAGTERGARNVERGASLAAAISTFRGRCMVIGQKGAASMNSAVSSEPAVGAVASSP